MRLFLLIVAVVGAILGLLVGPSLYVVYERERLRELIPQNGGSFAYFQKESLDGVEPDALPLTWSLFGAHPLHGDIELPADRFTDAEIRHIRALYPEIEVRVITPPAGK